MKTISTTKTYGLSTSTRQHQNLLMIHDYPTQKRKFPQPLHGCSARLYPALLPHRILQVFPCMDVCTCTLLQHAAAVFLSFRQIQKAQITEKINNMGNINVHRQDVVVDCVHPCAPRSTVFFSFPGKSDKSQEKNNNQILMPSMCIPIHNHASGQLSQITNEELRLCFTSTKNRKRVPHFFCSSNLLNRIK